MLSIGVVSLPRDGGIEPQATASTLHPMVGAGSIHMVRMEGSLAVIGEAEDFIALRLTLLHDRHRLPRRLRGVSIRDFGVDNLDLPDPAIWCEGRLT